MVRKIQCKTTIKLRKQHIAINEINDFILQSVYMLQLEVKPYFNKYGYINSFIQNRKETYV